MHEYEFRLVIQSSAPFLPLLKNNITGCQRIIYIEPHFRFRDGCLELKEKKNTEMVYFDGLWFRWVHSIETSFEDWTRKTRLAFIHASCNFQDPFRVETRYIRMLDDEAQIYTFQHDTGSYRLVFEWEYGAFSTPIQTLPATFLFQSLKKYRNVLALFKEYPSPAFVFKETFFRNPVMYISEVPNNSTKRYLFAHKLDGTFGLIYSYLDRVKQKWEGYECVQQNGITLGDGIVFAAEKMQNGKIILLDVYRVRGYKTATWSRRKIFKEFLPQLQLPAGYDIQRYRFNVRNLPKVPYKTDGLIVHDIIRNEVFKIKQNHSIDLVYSNGYFWLPDGRIKASEPLENGCVYEISIKNGQVVRKRSDRFTGNTAEQLKSVFQYGWQGPPIEPLATI